MEADPPVEARVPVRHHLLACPEDILARCQACRQLASDHQRGPAVAFSLTTEGRQQVARAQRLRRKLDLKRMGSGVPLVVRRRDAGLQHLDGRLEALQARTGKPLAGLGRQELTRQGVSQGRATRFGKMLLSLATPDLLARYPALVAI